MTLKMVYAGIGSRDTPPNILTVMRFLGASMLQKGFRLRSGGAVGADSAFAEGAAMNGFVANSMVDIFTAADAQKHDEWFAHARQFHPAWRLCSEHAKALHARNSAIVMGATLNDPVDFVICWTKTGKATGGTGQGIRIAQAHQIKVFNLYDDPRGYAPIQYLKDEMGIAP